MSGLTVASAGFDPTAIATLVLSGITLALVIATIALVRTTQDGTRQARGAAADELKMLARQVGSTYRPLLVDVLPEAPALPDMGALYDVTEQPNPNAYIKHPGPVVQTRLPGLAPTYFDPRTTFVSFQGAQIFISVALRNVGNGMAVIDDDGIALSGPMVGGFRWRLAQHYHVPVAESTRIDIVVTYVREEATELATRAGTLRGVKWNLVVPYHDFAGEQPAKVRLEIVCRGDEVSGPWEVGSAVQVTDD